ncbi:MAG: hypothetical protein QOI78_8297 [Actinomycetota bacterium]|nr:hypothetical protein [Actinomycetota bacterium]
MHPATAVRRDGGLVAGSAPTLVRCGFATPVFSSDMLSSRRVVGLSSRRTSGRCRRRTAPRRRPRSAWRKRPKGSPAARADSRSPCRSAVAVSSSFPTGKSTSDRQASSRARVVEAGTEISFRGGLSRGNQRASTAYSRMKHRADRRRRGVAFLFPGSWVRPANFGTGYPRAEGANTTGRRARRGRCRTRTAYRPLVPRITSRCGATIERGGSGAVACRTRRSRASSAMRSLSGDTVVSDGTP